MIEATKKQGVFGPRRTKRDRPKNARRKDEGDPAMKSDGWKTLRFQELIEAGLLEIGDGYRAKNEELDGTGPLFLRAGHVTDTHVDFEGVERFRAELADRVKPKMAVVGDTIVTTKGNSTGRTSFVSSRMPPFVYSPHLSYWRSLDHNHLAPGFLRYWSQGREFAARLEGIERPLRIWLHT